MRVRDDGGGDGDGDGGGVVALAVARGEVRTRRALALCMASLPQAGGCLVTHLLPDLLRLVVTLERGGE